MKLLHLKKIFDNFSFFMIPIKVAKGYRPEFKGQMNETLKYLIERCWSQEPTNRPSFDQIVDELENNRGYITDSVNEEEYFNYIKYIKEYKIEYYLSNDKIQLDSYAFHQTGFFKETKYENKHSIIIDINL